MYVTTEDQLLDICERLKDCKWLAIDTEFVGEKTYYPHLGLIQVSGNGISAAIDPIVIKNLTPFLDLVKNREVLKVFHAGEQDLEILTRLTGQAITPVFDTQIAASLLGWGAQISFAKIVQKVTGKKIHKAETYTDWCRRPLSKNQIEYAIDDVRYLVPVYEKLVERLKKMNRMEWLQDEFSDLEDPANYRKADPRRQFMKIKNIRSLKPANLAVLIELASWREEEAIRRDCHPRSIVRDEPLLEIARLLPKEAADLAGIRGFHHKETGKSAEQIMQAIHRGLAVPDEEVPVLQETESYSTRPGVEELLATYIQCRSEELKIEPTILASRKQVHEFVKCYEQKEDLAETAILKGWRRDLIGLDMRSLIEGRMGLSLDKNGKVGLIPNISL